MASGETAKNLKKEGWDVQDVVGYPGWVDFGYREENGNFVSVLRTKRENNGITHGQLLNFGGDAARIGVAVDGDGKLQLE